VSASGASLLDHRLKGIPGGVAPFPLEAIGAKGWNLLAEDLPLPVAVLKRAALAHNGRWMRDFLARSGAVIAPHGKTTMSPRLFADQVADGAWAITVATTQQLQVCRDFGFPRVVLANQLVGRQSIRYVLDELRRDPSFDFYCLVDSVRGVALLAEAARAHPAGRPLQVLLEGGFAGGRTGARDLPTALAVARAVKAASPHLVLRGVEGFEGLFAAPSPAETEAAVRSFLDFLVEIARQCDREGLFADGKVLLTAGGSAFYDVVVRRFREAGLAREVEIVTRSGCYLTHDSGLYRRAFEELRQRGGVAGMAGEGLLPAVEVWAYVQSRPEPEKVLLTLGKRDIGHDEPPPALSWYRPGTAPRRPAALPEGHLVTGFNDQHCHMKVPAGSPLEVGDMVAFGISHPCLTFDKWQLLPIVDEEYRVVDAVRTFF
jgi:D-serine dehydratase